MRRHRGDWSTVSNAMPPHTGHCGGAGIDSSLVFVSLQLEAHPHAAAHAFAATNDVIGRGPDAREDHFIIHEPDALQASDVAGARQRPKPHQIISSAFRSASSPCGILYDIDLHGSLPAVPACAVHTDHQQSGHDGNHSHHLPHRLSAPNRRPTAQSHCAPAEPLGCHPELRKRVRRFHKHAFDADGRVGVGANAYLSRIGRSPPSVKARSRLAQVDRIVAGRYNCNGPAIRDTEDPHECRKSTNRLWTYLATAR